LAAVAAGWAAAPFFDRVPVPAEQHEHDQEAEHVAHRHVPAVPRSQWPTERASGYMLDSATPADEPNQIIEPPKPTA
jgi:hypothetical protein